MNCIEATNKTKLHGGYIAPYRLKWKWCQSDFFANVYKDIVCVPVNIFNINITPYSYRAKSRTKASHKYINAVIYHDKGSWSLKAVFTLFNITGIVTNWCHGKEMSLHAKVTTVQSILHLILVRSYLACSKFPTASTLSETLSPSTLKLPEHYQYFFVTFDVGIPGFSVNIQFHNHASSK